jgi:hypothetical protein
MKSDSTVQDGRRTKIALLTLATALLVLQTHDARSRSSIIEQMSRAISGDSAAASEDVAPSLERISRWKRRR